MIVYVITPDRNDREQFLDHLRFQISCQTVQPDRHIIVNYPVEGEDPDLTARVKAGWINSINQADLCIIMENDDFYPDNYIETIINHAPGNDFIGFDLTVSYHLLLRAYMTIYHGDEFRSSLFTTAFRPEALLEYPWPSDDTVFLDIHLWHWVNLARLKYYLIQRNDIGIVPIGIKHGVGKCGGHLHSVNIFQHQDPEGKYLDSIIPRRESYTFYKEFAENLKNESFNSNSIP